MELLRLVSPAKINWSLRVLGKREDGYHDLSTLMQTVDLTDTIIFRDCSEDKFTCSDPTLPEDENNLVVKARDAFRKRTGILRPLHIHLEKHIPHRSGLAGGSSNAATTMWGLNMIYDTPATTSELMEWSADVGSDCPFFFSKGAALCRGRGEQVTEVDLQPDLPLWIVKPAFGLSTAKVFSQVTDFSFAGAAEQGNDLEEAAFSLEPRLRKIKSRLLQSSPRLVQMSGAGTSFVYLDDSPPPAIPGTAVFSVKTVHRCPEAWYSVFSETPEYATL